MENINQDNVCGTCKYFCQHYRKDGSNYSMVYCGHCVKIRVKKRVDDQKACEHWKLAKPRSKKPDTLEQAPEMDEGTDCP